MFAVGDNMHGMNQIRSISEVNISKFKNCLDEIDFNEILKMQCPNAAYNSFFVPRHGEAIAGGHRNARRPSVRPSVCPSQSLTSDFMHRFTQYLTQ